MADENVVQDDDFENDAPAPLDDDVEIVIDESDDAETEVDQDADEDDATLDDATAELEAQPEDAPVGDDDEDDELANQPPKVSELIRTRVAREKRKVEQAISEREQIRHAALQVAQIAKQQEDEVLNLRRQNAAIQKQFAETLDYAYERDIQIRAGALRRAREDGNYDDELKLQGELDQLRFQQNQIRQAKTTLPDPERIAPQRVVPEGIPQAAQQPQRPPPAPLAVKWLEKNQAWFANKKYAAHRAFVLQEDANLVEEGYDKHAPEYYKELDRRVDRAFPTLRKKATKSHSPVAPAASSPSRNTSSKTITLKKADLQNMRTFGLDPNNKEHLREYARSKRAA